MKPMSGSSPPVLDKRICVERRDENSVRVHHNRVGDWRPRLIVWPEYNGLTKTEFDEIASGELDDPTDDAWGKIIAGTVERFTQALDHRALAFEQKLPSLWDRVFCRRLPHIACLTLRRVRTYGVGGPCCADQDVQGARTGA